MDLEKDIKGGEEEIGESFYDMERTPINAAEDNKTGITFRGNDEKYLDAHKNIMNMVKKKGERFVVNGFDIAIMDVPNNKPVKIEIKPKNGLSGKVNLKIYDINRRGSATILITKPSGSDVAHVMNLGLKVVKYLLDSFISGNLHNEDIDVVELSLQFMG